MRQRLSVLLASKIHQATFPAVPIGTYLAACTAYAALYKRTPVGNTYTAGIDPALAAFLQNTAQETVSEYFGN